MLSVPSDIAEALERVATEAGPFATNVRHYPVVGSTSDEAAALAARGAPEGCAVVADAQTAGRGRRGRRWHSPSGAGLYLSVVFRPHETSPAPTIWQTTSMLTLMSGVAVAEAIRECTDLPVTIKWPNDIVVDSRPLVRKLAGILAEGAVSGDRLQYVIVGIGVNLRGGPWLAELAGRATSIEDELGRPCDRATLLGALLSSLARWRGSLVHGDVDALVGRWRALSPSSAGSRVSWAANGAVFAGTTRGIDEQGALIVDTGEALERIVAGELTWG